MKVPSWCKGCDKTMQPLRTGNASQYSKRPIAFGNAPKTSNSLVFFHPAIFVSYPECLCGKQHPWEQAVGEMLIRYSLYSWTEAHDKRTLHFQMCVCLHQKHVCVRKCGLMHGRLTLICSKSLSFSTLTLRLTILSRAVLARRMESSLVEGSHCPQRSTKLLNTRSRHHNSVTNYNSVCKYKDVRFSRIMGYARALCKVDPWWNPPEWRTAVDKSDGFSDVTIFVFSKPIHKPLMEHLHLSLKTAYKTIISFETKIHENIIKSIMQYMK